MISPVSVCPHCGNDGRTLLAEQRFLEPANDRIVGPLPERQVRYMYCTECQTVSMDPLPLPSQLDHYYAGPSLEDGGPGQDAVMAQLDDARLETIAQVTGLTEGTCLEIGAGPGRLLARVQDRLGLRCTGLEPSTGYPERSDVRILRATLDQAASQLDAGYDLVLCCNVLEHVAEPGPFLATVTQRVAAGGWIYIEVPSGELLARGARPAYGQNIYPLHLHHFTGSGLSAALQAQRMTTVRLEHRNVAGYPVLTLMARRDDPHGAGRRFLTQFEHQLTESHKASLRLTEFAAAGPVLVWGAGIDVFEMMAFLPDGFPDRCDLFDRNPDKQRRLLAGCPILTEDEVAQRAYQTILAGSRHPSLAAAILEDARKAFPDAAYHPLFPCVDGSLP